MLKHFYFLLALVLSTGIAYSQDNPFDYRKDTILVYIFMLEDCVITQNYTLSLRQLHEKYATDKLHFVGLFPNKFSNNKSIAAFKEKYKVPFELKMDYYKTRTKKMGATVTPTVVVYNQTKDLILYRGRIDNAYFRIGKKRTITTTSELADALQAIANGKEILVKETEAVGCFINFNL